MHTAATTKDSPEIVTPRIYSQTSKISANSPDSGRIKPEKAKTMEKTANLNQNAVKNSGFQRVISKNRPEFGPNQANSTFYSALRIPATIK